jgi:hypothetical protein
MSTIYLTFLVRAELGDSDDSSGDSGIVEAEVRCTRRLLHLVNSV